MIFMKKIKFNEQQTLLQEVVAATRELDRVRTMYDYAEDIDLAIMELTAAEMKYKFCYAKLKKYATGEVNFNLFQRVF